MLDYQDKEDLKTFLIGRKNLLGGSPFEKTEIFCDERKLNFKAVMQEAVQWQEQFDGIINDDNALLYTIL